MNRAQRRILSGTLFALAAPPLLGAAYLAVLLIALARSGLSDPVGYLGDRLLIGGVALLLGTLLVVTAFYVRAGGTAD